MAAHKQTHKYFSNVRSEAENQQQSINLLVNAKTKHLMCFYWTERAHHCDIIVCWSQNAKACVAAYDDDAVGVVAVAVKEQQSETSLL